MEPPRVVNPDNETSLSEGTRERGEPCRRLLCELLRHFAHNSTLHGLRYLTARGLSTLERIFWGIILVTSICLCAMAMSKVLVKWQTSPIIISVNEHLTSVSEVPFPAVTICPMTKVKQEYYNFTKHFITFKKFKNKLESEDVTESEKRNIINDFVDKTPYMRELVSINYLVCPFIYVSGGLDYNCVQHMIKAAPTMRDIFAHYGKWQHEYIQNDNTYFAPVLTEEGICFTFNTLAANEIFHMERIHKNYSYLNASTPRKGWAPQIGYYNSSHDTYPRRGSSNSGLSRLLLKDDENSDICQGEFPGYKVYLHHPADLPRSSNNYYAVEIEKYAVFSVKVNLVSTSDTLINYPPHIRQCYFPSERALHFFKEYTQSNCRLECLTNYTITRCRCGAHYMPRNHSTFMCTSLRQRSCAYIASFKYSESVDGRDNSPESLCQCLPPCLSVQYEADVQYVQSEQKKYQSNTWRLVFDEIFNGTEPDEDEESIWVYSSFQMHFKDGNFTSLRRSELFSATDFLANCGGLLGLFLGFSFLSLVELLYFATLRLACMFSKQRKAEKKAKSCSKTSELSKF